MNWKGIWKNQYGSIVEITDDADNQIAGSFRTALVDSGFHGKEIPIFGVHHGDCISFAGGGKTAAGDPQPPSALSTMASGTAVRMRSGSGCGCASNDQGQ